MYFLSQFSKKNFTPQSQSSNLFECLFVHNRLLEVTLSFTFESYCQNVACRSIFTRDTARCECVAGDLIYLGGLTLLMICRVTHVGPFSWSLSPAETHRLTTVDEAKTGCTWILAWNEGTYFLNEKRGSTVLLKMFGPLLHHHASSLWFYILL